MAARAFNWKRRAHHKNEPSRIQAPHGPILRLNRPSRTWKMGGGGVSVEALQRLQDAAREMNRYEPRQDAKEILAKKVDDLLIV
mmetsp:Transcript_18987/g.31492  ORF Transcript_18987/g.31492 Transcript_18987/m.31492 type:complete len:84 (+) Transcript_18987:250-501(+)